MNMRISLEIASTLVWFIVWGLYNCSIKAVYKNTFRVTTAGPIIRHNLLKPLVSETSFHLSAVQSGGTQIL